MTDKDITKDSFSRDIDDTIDTILPVMVMMVMMMFMIPMLPVVQSAQQYFQSQQFLGKSVSWVLSATQMPQHIVMDNPLVGVYIVNNGPSVVYLRINSMDSVMYPLGVLETLTFNRLGAQERIYAIYYKCDAGGTATVEVIGEY